MKVLFFTHDLAYRGAARQLTLFAAGLPRERSTFVFSQPVLTVPGRGPSRERHFGRERQRRRLFDLRTFLALRQQVRDFRPDIIHVFGVPALRALALTGGRAGARVVLSAAVSGERDAAGPARSLVDRHDCGSGDGARPGAGGAISPSRHPRGEVGGSAARGPPNRACRNYRTPPGAAHSACRRTPVSSPASGRWSRRRGFATLSGHSTS